MKWMNKFNYYGPEDDDDTDCSGDDHELFGVED